MTDDGKRTLQKKNIYLLQQATSTASKTLSGSLCYCTLKQIFTLKDWYLICWFIVRILEVRLPKRHNRLNVQQQNNHPVLQPLYRSTCLSQHLHIRIGGFCWCKVLLPACSADGNQRIHIREKTLEFSSTLSLYLIYMYLRLNVTHIHTHSCLTALCPRLPG